MNFNTNTTVSTSAIAELYTLKQDLMAELVRAQVKHEFKDMSATIDYIQEGLVTVNQSIKEEMAAMSKSTVLGVGRIVNGRITYVSRDGGVSRPMGARFPAMGTVTKESFMDADYKPTLDVRFPTVQPTEVGPMEGADYVAPLEVRFPTAGPIAEMQGADYVAPLEVRFPTVKPTETQPMEDADYVAPVEVRFPTVQLTQPMQGADYDEVLEGEVLDVRFPMVQTGPVVGEDFDGEPTVWVRDERTMDAYDRIFGINK